jgi:hypothetical protein
VAPGVAHRLPNAYGARSSRGAKLPAPANISNAPSRNLRFYLRFYLRFHLRFYLRLNERFLESTAVNLPVNAPPPARESAYAYGYLFPQTAC